MEQRAFMAKFAELVLLKPVSQQNAAMSPLSRAPSYLQSNFFSYRQDDPSLGALLIARSTFCTRGALEDTTGLHYPNNFQSKPAFTTFQR